MTDSGSPGTTPSRPDTNDHPEALDSDRVRAIAEAIIENIDQTLIGQRDAIEHVVVAVLANGHVLLEDVPGVGKTLLARTLANSIESPFRRIQFTPDLLPSDITGVNVFNQKTQSFEFRPGPLFASIVLGDEINRAPPKTQSALLEAMEEGQVTVDGESHELPKLFVVLATQNVIEPHRTYDLPIAQLDRFMKTVSLGYPSEREEIELTDRILTDQHTNSITPVVDTTEVLMAQQRVAAVTVEKPIRTYATKLVGYTRTAAELGGSPRATISLLRAARARALLNGREYVIPDDVQTEARPVLSHRIRPNLENRQGDGDAVVKEALDTIPVQ